jgi:very-short-patch-repair endonuclease
VADSNSAGSGPYFADFCCVAQDLIIELDASQHAEPEEERKDQLRTAYLNQQGYRVPRFWNAQANTEVEGVLAKPFMQP